MIVDNTNRVFEHSNDLKSWEFAVKGHNMKHLMLILRDQLYSDKILAPIREYACNAYDANIENGKKDVPIKVTLPNSMFLDYKIRDFGKGLSFQEMVDIFCSYGESTKRNSNDFIGQLGIGSKSGFAYGDNFIVTSYHDNKKSTYNCVLDKNGTGSILLLSTEDSNEPSGLEISIPVKNEDISLFISKSINFFKFWNVKPEFVGLTDQHKNAFVNSNEEFISEDKWKLYFSKNAYELGSYLVMGNIAYPINYNTIDSYLNKIPDYHKFKSFIVKGMIGIFTANIGEIDHAPSRESLQYTDKTINYIVEIIADIINKIVINVNKKINEALNFWEAKCLYRKLFKFSDSTNKCYDLSSALIGKITYKDIIINDDVISNLNRIPSNKEITLDYINGYKYTEYPALHKCVFHSTFKISNKGNNTILCHENNRVLILIADEITDTHKKMLKSYIKEKSINCIHLFLFNNNNIKDSFLKLRPEFNYIPILNIEEINKEYLIIREKEKIARAEKRLKNSKIVNKNKKIVKYINLNHKILYIYEKEIDLTNFSGYVIYLNSDRRVEINKKTFTLTEIIEHLHNLKDSIQELVIITPGIKNSKLYDKSKWIDIIEYIKTTNHNIMDCCYDYLAEKYFDKYKPNIIYLNKRVMDKIIACGINDKNGIFAKMYYDQYKPYTIISDSSKFNALESLNIFTCNDKEYIDKNKKLNLLFSKITQYELLKCIFSNPYKTDYYNSEYKMAADYINMVDFIKPCKTITDNS